jgi:hypothetical protein
MVSLFLLLWFLGQPAIECGQSIISPAAPASSLPGEPRTQHEGLVELPVRAVGPDELFMRAALCDLAVV